MILIYQLDRRGTLFVEAGEATMGELRGYRIGACGKLAVRGGPAEQIVALFAVDGRGIVLIHDMRLSTTATASYGYDAPVDW